MNRLRSVAQLGSNWDPDDDNPPAPLFYPPGRANKNKGFAGNCEPLFAMT